MTRKESKRQKKELTSVVITRKQELENVLSLIQTKKTDTSKVGGKNSKQSSSSRSLHQAT